MATILVLATLDTKGREAIFLKERIKERGCGSILMDIGTYDSDYEAEITNSEVSRASGYELHEIRKKGRPFCVEAMKRGGEIIVRRLISESKIHGILGIGGGTGTSISTHIMRALPYGFPKIMVSTVASRDVREYVGLRDIVMFHSVADLLGFNEFTRFILDKAAQAICSMAEGVTGFSPGKPLVSLTVYGINSLLAKRIEPLLNEKGYELICFHANGTGGLAMEEMVREGLIEGVLDLTLHEIADDIFGGYCKGAGEQRLRIESSTGVPVVLAPGGLDNAVFSPSYPMPKKFEGRKIHYHDERFCVRMEKDEMSLFARIIGERLRCANSKIRFFVPLGGFSEIDRLGSDFYEEETIRFFLQELKSNLPQEIELEEIEGNITEESFCKRVVDALFEMIGN